MSQPTLSDAQKAILGKFSGYETHHEITQQYEDTPYKKVTTEPPAKDLWNNNIIWEFAKGLSPGMDLTKIPFPVCITQARSFLQNFTDYFEHWNLISKAANEDDPYKRMKLVTQWYLSGFAHAMKVVRKPYNPILGEVFRCMWQNENTGSKTHYIAEQVSHHPPISSFYVTNREDGWVGYGTVTFSVSFYGVSAWAYLNGNHKIKLLKYDEEYTWCFPPTKASGFFVGPFIMEMGGVVTIKNNKNDYWANLDFKTSSMFSSANLYKVEGKIMQKDTIVDTLQGQYFEKIFIGKEIFLDAKVPPETPTRYEVPEDKLWGKESQYVWKDLTAAVVKGDGQDASDKKWEVEEWQRLERQENERKQVVFKPRFFEKVNDTEYHYIYANEAPFSKGEEESFEMAGMIMSRRKK
ncbi:oxysterol-binding protein, putative [Entamoeba invadens IP1]|uniref:Oxysterol-binding protein, putative n=2 Tax=Entamoeba invadens TaxID=33085 RepID=A0A0A1U8X7_ENTIV|nr:oxysterol-binding protein, putative [Entamoeba invadens IP1]ELP91302.1 oxysterol-binding protein, putative [Entamoeba invadens IP1]BAN42367.1 oxysterol-binding protein, putative [Entamoeba invadens]|eukprot:XP_004258073.1 oxysterol-binding protein, putative [Entamoeba invadens IP1]